MSDAGAPSAPLRSESELQAILQTRTGPIAALSAGARLAARTAGIGLPVALAYGAVSGGVSIAVLDLVERASAAERPMVELASQLTIGAGIFASIYALIQFFKRDRASRRSWWPALFAMPLLLTGGALYMEFTGAAKSMGPVVDSLVYMATAIVVQTFAGAVAAIAWLRAGNETLEGRSPDPGAILAEARGRMLEVAGPHGAKVHAVTIGAQLLLPGIFYALQLAFTECIVVLDPEKPALRRSGQLTSGIRGRIFRMLLAWWLVGMAVSLGVTGALEGKLSAEGMGEIVSSYIVDPAAFGTASVLAGELGWALLTWPMWLALLVLYREREAQVKARAELKKLKAGAAG